jgi:hypothetical protein
MAMSKKPKTPLPARVEKAAAEALAARDYVSPIDVLVGLGWLQPEAVERWRRGQVDYLERVVETNLHRISEAMHLFRSWAVKQRLNPSETGYVTRKPRRETLRFSKSGDATIERLYRTHWVSPALSEKKQQRLAEKVGRAPELLVIQPLNKDWTCHKCGATGGFLTMDGPGPVCLGCAGLGDLVMLPAGNALLTRRVKAKSERNAVVVRFSKSRGRYERQGLLVEAPILTEIARDLGVSMPE